MGVDIPQWLSQTYVRSVQAAGSTLPKEKLAQACRDLISRWSTPERRYHNIQHLIDTLTRVETLLPSTHSPHLVQLAALYHGAVFSVDMKDIYTRNGGEDENASAHLAEEELAALGVTEDAAVRVGQLIRSLREHNKEVSSQKTAKFQAIDVDALVLHDAHLGCLSVEPQRYRTYVSQVRDEYAEVSDIGFCAARYEIVSRFLHRRPLFITPLARDWEESARDNLESEREKLTKKLKELEMFATLNSRLSRDSVPARVPVPDYIGAARDENSRDERERHTSEHAPASGSPIPPPDNSGEETAQFSTISSATPDEVELATQTTPTTGELPTEDTTNTQSQKKVQTKEQEKTQTKSQAKTREKARSSIKTSEIPRSSKKSFSSLEDISERIETSKTSARVEKTRSDEKKKRHREAVAEQMRLRMSQREAATREKENTQDMPTLTSPTSASNAELSTPPDTDASPDTVAPASVTTSAPSVATPEDTPFYGMEREPDD